MALLLGLLGVLMWLTGLVAKEKDVDYFRAFHILAAMSFSAAMALMTWFLLSFR